MKSTSLPHESFLCGISFSENEKVKRQYCGAFSIMPLLFNLLLKVVHTFAVIVVS